PEPVIGHRFRQTFDSYVVPWEHLLANQLRMARKIFTDAVWFDWLDRYSCRQPAGLWESGWRQFLAGNESVERERAYLMANRVRDEHWYARAFGQSWPAAAPPVAAAGRTRGPGPSGAPLSAASLSVALQQAVAAAAARTAVRGTFSPSP